MANFATADDVLYISGQDDLTEMTFRRARQALQHLSEGVEAGTDFEVSQTGAGAMSVDVAGGYAWIQGTVITGPEGQHVYGVPLTDASVTLDGITAPVSSTRRDLVILRVYDEGDNPGSGLIEARVEYLTNPSEVTTDPTLPDDSIILAHVTVTTSHTQILDADITDRRVMRGVNYGSKDGNTYIQRADDTGKPEWTDGVTSDAIITQPELDTVTQWPFLLAYASTTNQVINNSTITKVDFNVETYDTANAFDLGTDTYTVPEAGIYLVVFNFRWKVSVPLVVGEYLAWVYLNGSPVPSSYINTLGGTDTLPIQGNITGQWYLTAGNTIDCRVLQNTGAARTIADGGNLGTHLVIRKIGEI